MLKEKMSFQFVSAVPGRFVNHFFLCLYDLLSLDKITRMVAFTILVMMGVSAVGDAEGTIPDITCVTVEQSTAFEKGKETEAKAAALRAALEKAVVVTLAIDDWNEALWMHQLSCNRQIPIPYVTVESQSVVDERVVERGAERQYAYIKLKTCVKEELPFKDMEFRLTAYLNRTAFTAGQEKKLTIKTTKDCFIYVFEMLDDTAMMIIPAKDFIRDKKENRIMAFGEPFVFPSEDFVKYVAPFPPEGKRSADVLIVILALKRPFDAYGLDTDSGAVVSIQKLIRAITTIPVSERVVVALPYSVKKPPRSK